MRFLFVCLLALAGSALAQPALPEPPVYALLHYQDQSASSGKLEPIPREGVQVNTRKGQARLKGEQAKVRFRHRALPPLVIAYAQGPAPAWYARMYRMEPRDGQRVTALGVWSYVTAKKSEPGAIPLKMERYGKLSYRLIPPPDLPPGEYAITNPGGNAVYAFGVDPQ
ncbi:MAG: hypothetical protein HY858_12380 [Candidatus Solibacter usitatus]|nr:hypothetical protein [Candidatus Solibacter usitatus]